MSQPKKKLPELPYANSKISVYQTQGEISKLLEDYGAEGVQWTSFFRENRVNLKFILKTKEGKAFTVEVIPPDIRVGRRTWNTEKYVYEKILVPAWPQSMRLLYWYIESKLKAIHWGLVSIEKEFLSDILVPLKDGSQRSVFEIIINPLTEGRLAIEEKPPEPRERPQVIVDADYTEEEKK